MTDRIKKPVTERALLRRINRYLYSHDSYILRKARSYTWELGEYYGIDMHSGNVDGTGYDLEELGAELGVYNPAREAMVPAS